MKAETIAEQLVKLIGETKPAPNMSYILTWGEVMQLARACEQHGVERAKQLVDLDVWKDLDAEIAKENEDG